MRIVPAMKAAAVVAPRRSTWVWLSSRRRPRPKHLIRVGPSAAGYPTYRYNKCRDVSPGGPHPRRIVSAER